jgi:hypothetical protein
MALEAGYNWMQIVDDPGDGVRMLGKGAELPCGKHSALRQENAPLGVVGDRVPLEEDRWPAREDPGLGVLEGRAEHPHLAVRDGPQVKESAA